MRNIKGIINRRFLAVLVFNLFFILTYTCSFTSAAIPPITGPSTPITYTALENPVLSDNPSIARPIGIGKLATGGGDELNIKVTFNEFSEAVDIYFLFDYKGKLYSYKNGSFPEVTASTVLTDIVWKSWPVGPDGINSSILKLGKTELDSLKQTLTSEIKLVVVVMKSGSTLSDFNAGKYYDWGTTISLATFTVTPSAGEGGSISPSAPQKVSSGSTTLFTLTPTTGYKIQEVTGCSGTLAGSTYTTGAITGDCAVTATFTKEVTGGVLLTVTKSGTGSGTVTSSPSGINCGSTCSSLFTAGQNVTLTSMAAEGSIFSSDNWSGCDSKFGNQCTVALSSAKEVKAIFNTSSTGCVTSLSPTEKLDFTTAGGASTITVTAPPDCKWKATSSGPSWLTVTSGSSGTGNGTVNYSVAANTDGSAKDGVIYIGSNNDRTHTVKQAGTGAPSQTYTLTVTKSGSGEVTASSGTINWNGTTGTAAYTGSPAVTLTATPQAANYFGGGSTFGGWSGCDSASGATCTVTMSSAKTVTATFTSLTTGSTACVTSINPLTFNFPATGGTGTINVTAPSTCNWTASPGIGTTGSITITSGNSGTGSGVVGFSVGAITGSGGSVNITIGGKTFTVTQDAAAATPKKLTVITNSGTGGGKVTSNPAGIDCDSTNPGTGCSYTFPVGTATVALTAAADANSNFISWSGCTGTAADTCNVSMDSDKTVYAVFNKAEPTLTVTKTGTGSGTVTLSTGTINWSSNTGTVIYTGMPTVNVTLTAAANPNSDFKAWGGDCAALGVGNTCTVKVEAKGAKYVSAEFNSCVSITPASQYIGLSGGTANVITVTATSSNCSWSATTNASWITIKTGGSGTGSGTITYDVTPNSGTSRTGTIKVSEQTFTVSQAGGATSTVPYEDMTAYMTDDGQGWHRMREAVPVQAIYWQDTQKTIQKSDPNVKYPNYGRHAKFYKYTVPEKYLNSCSGLIPQLGGNIDTPISENMIVTNRDFMTEENAWNLYLGVNGVSADGSAGPGYNSLGYGLCMDGVGKNGDCKNPTSSGSTMLDEVYSYARSNYAKPVGTEGQKIWHRFSQDYSTESVTIDFQKQGITDRTFYIMITCEDNTASTRLWSQCIFTFDIGCY